MYRDKATITYALCSDMCVRDTARHGTTRHTIAECQLDTYMHDHREHTTRTKVPLSSATLLTACLVTLVSFVQIVRSFSPLTRCVCTQQCLGKWSQSRSVRVDHKYIRAQTRHRLAGRQQAMAKTTAKLLERRACQSSDIFRSSECVHR